MLIDVQEALDLFQKWRSEKRAIHCIGLNDDMQFKILGRIDSVEIENAKIHFSQTQSKAPLGEKTFIEFSIVNAKLEYSDAVDFKQLAISRMPGHDAIMTITYPSGTVIGFDVLAPLEEIKQL